MCIICIILSVNFIWRLQITSVLYLNKIHNMWKIIWPMMTLENVDAIIFVMRCCVTSHFYPLEIFFNIMHMSHCWDKSVWQNSTSGIKRLFWLTFSLGFQHVCRGRSSHNRGRTLLWYVQICPVSRKLD